MGWRIIQSSAPRYYVPAPERSYVSPGSMHMHEGGPTRCCGAFWPAAADYLSRARELRAAVYFFSRDFSLIRADG